MLASVPEPVPDGPLAERLRRVLGGPGPALLLALLPLGALVLGAAKTRAAPAAAWADLALLEIGTRAALHGERLLGPYSRFGWCHPGPFLFYWNAPFYAASGEHAGGLALAATAWNAVGAGLAVLAGWSLARRAGAYAAAFGLLMILGRFPIGAIRSPWNPALTVLPVAVALVCAVGVASGRRWAVPGFTAAASIAVQTHVGTAPTLLATGGLAVVWAAWRHRRAVRAWLWPWWPTLAITAALWTLPVVEQLTTDRGNLGSLLDFFLRGSDGQPWDDAATMVVHLASGSLADLGDVVGSGAPITAPFPRSLLVLGLTAAALGVGSAVGDLRHRRVLRAWTAVGTVAFAAAVFSAHNVTDVLMPYLLAFVAGIAVFLRIGACLAVLAVVVRVLPAGGRRPQPHASIRTGLAAVGIGCATAFSLAATTEAARLPPFAATSSNADVAAVLRAATGALGEPTVGPVDVEVRDHGAWPVAAGLVAGLERAGRAVTVEDHWVSVYGPGHRRRPGDAVPHLVVGLTAASAAPRGGEREILKNERVVVHLRPA